MRLTFRQTHLYRFVNMEVTPRFEPEDLMSWTVSNLQRPFREDFSLEKSGIIAEKESQIFGRRFVGFDRPKKAAPFFNF